MRINEENIDYNTQRIIDECIANPFLCVENDVENDNTRLMMLGYIRGVLDFAKCMKEVLKA